MINDKIANTDKMNIEIKKITSGLVVVDDILYSNLGFQINLDVIKNEAEVWLRENIFLRSLIAQMAPKNKKEFSSYHSEVMNKFKRMGMFQTVELLNADPITEGFRLTLNMIVESLYGKQKTEKEAAIVADQEISYWDFLIASENKKLTWCADKQYPILSCSAESEKVREIIIRTETQKNIINKEEFEKIINESEIKKQLNKWNEYICQILGFKYNSDK